MFYYIESARHYDSAIKWAPELMAQKLDQRWKLADLLHNLHIDDCYWPSTTFHLDD